MMAKSELVIAITFFSLLAAGCSTTKEDFAEYSLKYGKNNPNHYCAYSIPQTRTGHYPVNTDGRYACGETRTEAEEKSLHDCGHPTINVCMVAFTYFLRENKMQSWESYHVERISKGLKAQQEAARIARLEWEQKQNEKLMQTCDGYGFKRETADHSNCVLQVATANRVQQQKQNEMAAQEAMLKEIKKQQALNSLILLNNSVNPPNTSITCNPSGIGGMTCN